MQTLTDCSILNTCKIAFVKHTSTECYIKICASEDLVSDCQSFKCLPISFSLVPKKMSLTCAKFIQ